MKILVISFYYPPDLSAGAFRAQALVRSLIEGFPRGSQVELVTSCPNRYNGFSIDAPQCEQRVGVVINRIPLPNHKSGIFDQSYAFFKFAIGALKFCREKNYDLVFATSSRLMSATLGAYISKKIKAPLYLDIRDIFVDTIGDIFPKKISLPLALILEPLEKWTVRAASKINLVSEGFRPYFAERYPNQDFSFFTNGIDDEFINCQPIVFSQGHAAVLRVLYAGNFGEGQGLHNIIPSLCQRFIGRLHFTLVGDGGRKQQLISAIEREGCTNVDVLPPVKRSDLFKIYQASDVLFLHLNDYNAFEKVLPSKIFEYAATGKPIWAGVGGYAAKFINENVENAIVFTPCDIEEAVASFEKLAIETRVRDSFVRKFSRTTIMKKMAVDVISCLNGK